LKSTTRAPPTANTACIRQHTYTSAYGLCMLTYADPPPTPPAYVSIRQHTVSIRQHTHVPRLALSPQLASGYPLYSLPLNSRSRKPHARTA
jgi:hypothetical protein